MLTENDAKAYRCCGPDGCGLPIMTAGKAEIRLCIGSGCMAWRWGQKRNPNWKPDYGMMSSTPQHPDDRPDPYIRDDEHGYCGLAGRP